MTEKRKPGGQPGNKCAAKDVHAKRVTFRLYPEDRQTLVVLATRWNVSKSEAMRMALQMAVETLQ